jgi:uncharacterized protein with von Willebrand factor type A (vWA) domain
VETVSDQAITAAVERFSGLRGQGTLTNLMAFGRVLKGLGFKISLSQVIDASRSLGWVDMGNKPDFRTVLRSNLISNREDMPLFDRVFDRFWRQEDRRPDEPLEDIEVPGGDAREKTESSEQEEAGLEEILADGNDDRELEDISSELSLPVYSPVESLSKKDFSEMGVEESRAIRKAILLIAQKIATQVSRRRKRANRGDEIDPRWSMRRSLKYGGDLVEFAYRKRRIKKTRIVLLCDVSGSMDCYSRFLIQFMYGLQNELWGVETFVFSTALSRITHLIRTRNIESALERISHTVVGWSGGTNIGGSLHTFNREFAPSLVTHRTVVVVISDGWDRGDVSLLEHEMQSLKRRCNKIIWLNPLLASENYEPLCKGMQAALPYIDYFLSVHNLSSLVALGQKLQKVA